MKGGQFQNLLKIQNQNKPKRNNMAKQTKTFIAKPSDKSTAVPGNTTRTEKFGRTIVKPVSVKKGKDQ